MEATSADVGGAGGAGGAGASGGTAGAGNEGGEGGSPAACPDGFAMGDFYGKPTAQVTIDGLGPFSFIVDTGAPTTVIDVSLKASLMGDSHAVDMAGQTMAMPLPYALDLASLGIQGKQGIIGTDFLESFALNLDYQRSRLWLTVGIDDDDLSVCEHVAGAADSHDLFFNGHFYVPGKIESVEGQFLVDTGATFGGIGETLFASVDADNPRPSLGGFYTQAAIGTFWSRFTRLGAIQVGRHQVQGVLARTLPDDVLPTGPANETSLGLLSSGFFRHFLVTLDYQAQVLRLDPYAGDPLVEETGYYSAGIGLAEQLDETVVAEVLPGSSAESAGIMVGDRIVTINGVPLATASPAAWSWALTVSTEGAQIPLQINRDGESLSIDVTADDILSGP